MIGVVATEPHFVAHLEPVWRLIPEELRARFWVGSNAGSGALAEARRRQIPQLDSGYPREDFQGVVMNAAIGDLTKTLAHAGRARVAFFEHGCGISYSNTQASYAGSPRRPNVDLFCFPGEIPAARQRLVHPERRIEVIGSSPKLDRWAGYKHQRSDPPTVAVTFHWDCQVAPETRSALPFYRQHLGLLVGQGWNVIGHAHPRIAGFAEVAFRKAGIAYEASLDRIMETADLLVVDNSSVLYEFAVTGRPVVVMNCPRYRRNVSHGIRFWDHVPGLQCDRPQDLPGSIEAALRDPPGLAALREAACVAVYPHHDGHSAARAAQAVVELARALERSYPESDEPPKSLSPVWVVTADDGTEHAFLVAGEAQRLARKRGWALSEP